MEYRFIAAANPAYRPFITKFFTEGGIEFVDQYMDGERAQAIFRQLSPKKPKTRAEEIFCELIGRRKYEPQGMLQSRNVLEMIFGKLTESKLAELALLLPANSGQKLTFNKDDIGQHIAKFYTVDLRVAFLTDLEDENPKSLYKYARSEDEKQFPSTRPFDQQKYNDAVRAWVEKLVLWTNQVSPANVADEVTSVIAEHEATPYASHKKRRSYRGKVYSEFCAHGSKYVELSGGASEDGTFNLWLYACRRPEYSEVDPGPYIVSPHYSVEPQHG
jgi:hypothetical protein